MPKKSKKTLLTRGAHLTRVVQVTLPAIARSFQRTERVPDVAFPRFRGGRDYAFLLTALSETGPVAVNVGAMHRVSTRLPRDLFEKNVRIARTKAPFSIGGQDDGANIVMDGHYYTAGEDPEWFRLPYFAHPHFYTSGEFRTSRSARTHPRKKRIFFAGTINDAAYDNGFKFPIMRRGEIFQRIYANFSRYISDDLSGDRAVTIVSTSETADDVKKHSLDARAYMAALARADFFICPPGWLMPNCHNMIEAMSVGAIPITNYAGYMFPPLVDGVTCVTFAEGPSLNDAMDRALAMPPHEIARMRAAVVDYYDRNLDPSSVGKQIRNRFGQIRRIIANDESGR